MKAAVSGRDRKLSDLPNRSSESIADPNRAGRRTQQRPSEHQTRKRQAERARAHPRSRPISRQPVSQHLSSAPRLLVRSACHEPTSAPGPWHRELSPCWSRPVPIFWHRRDRNRSLTWSRRHSRDRVGTSRRCAAESFRGRALGRWLGWCDTGREDAASISEMVDQGMSEAPRQGRRRVLGARRRSARA